MLISKELNKAINAQVGNEFGASLQYIAIASYFEEDGLPALAAHFFNQADEERAHAMKFVRYILEAGGHVTIPEIKAPKCEFNSAEEAVQLSLDWEKDVTNQINQLMDMAAKEPDYAAQAMLEWFVTEQLEEVSSMDFLLKMVKRAGEQNLLYVEHFLSSKAGKPDAAQGATE
ncbi:MAG: ferritin [Verrucomicrobia bacterium]|nr:ferritin [Verrucomicrobiota bacterium]